MTDNAGLVTQISDEIKKIPLIDTHEHTARWDDPAIYRSTLFDLLRGTYVAEDFQCTGMRQDDWKRGATDVGQAWIVAKERLTSIRNTAYYRTFLWALRDLYGMDFEEMDERTWRLLSERVSAAYARPGWCKHVLRDRCHIDVALWDRVDAQPEWPTLDRDIFIPVLRLDQFMFAHRPNVRAELGRTYGVDVLTFRDCVDLLESVINSAPARGIAAIKCNAAYQRSLAFEPSNEALASNAFALAGEDVGALAAKAFEDYIMDLIVQHAGRLDLPVQIHTGMLSGPGFLAGSDPMLLADLIQRHPKTRFVLFHGGYPFTTEVGILAKSFDNVYLDANWLPLISPTAMKQALHEWIESVPLAKVFIWGGDSYRVEGTYASLLQVTQVVSEVMAEKMVQGHLSDSLVSRILWDVFRRNAAQFYKTDLLKNWRPGAVPTMTPTAA